MHELRWPKRLAATAGLALGIGAGSAIQAQALLPREALRDEVAQVRQEFLQRDRAFSAAARIEAGQRLDALQAREEAVDLAWFRLELARIAALADNAHTVAGAMGRARLSNRVDLRLAPFGQEFRVLRTRPADADLLGMRLAAIDDLPVERLREAAHQLAGGLAAWRDRTAPLLFESPEQLHALGLIADRNSARYRFIRDDGSTLERRLSAMAPSPTRAQASTDRLLLPEVTPPELGWSGVLPIDQAPWAWQQALRSFRWRHDPARSMIVVQMRQVQDAREQRLDAFFSEVRTAVHDLRPTHLVLDVRHNGGGDLTKGRDFAASLPSLVPGRVFVLTSPWTFSAAITLVGHVWQAAPSRVQIVGEPVGDRLVFFAEGRPLQLRHSGVSLLAATQRHDYLNGCDGADDCHPPVRDRPIRAPSLAPHRLVPMTFAAYRRGVDEVMQAVEHALER